MIKLKKLILQELAFGAPPGAKVFLGGIHTGIAQKPDIDEAVHIHKVGKGMFSVSFYGKQIGVVQKKLDKMFGESWIGTPVDDDIDGIEEPTKKQAIRSLVKVAN